jgi:hypothetical protein
MVDREFDKPLWVPLGRSRGLCVQFWSAIGAYVGGLGEVLGLGLISIYLYICVCVRACVCVCVFVCVRVGDLGPLLGLYGRS